MSTARIDQRTSLRCGTRMGAAGLRGMRTKIGLTMQRSAALLALMLLACIGLPGTALAQDLGSWPDKPVRVLVPSSPGGPSDLAARLITNRMLVELKQSLVADARPGAGGMIALRQGARAAPDGYTLTIGNPGPVAVVPHTETDVGYDILADFEPISTIMTVPIVLNVRDDVPAKTVPELVALIRANSSSINFGSSGLGQSPHMAAELFARMIGVNFVISPYKGASPAVNDLLVGSIQAMFDTTTGLPMVKQGRLRTLAIASSKRSTLMPSVLTMGELGFPDFALSSWYILLAPARTPQPIIRRLNKLVNDTLNSPDVRHQLATVNAEAILSTPEETREFIRAELANWGNVVKRIRAPIK